MNSKPTSTLRGSQLHWADGHVMTPLLGRGLWSEMDWKRVWGIRMENHRIVVFFIYLEHIMSQVLYKVLEAFLIPLTSHNFWAIKVSLFTDEETASYREQNHTAKGWHSWDSIHSALLHSLLFITSLCFLLRDAPHLVHTLRFLRWGGWGERRLKAGGSGWPRTGWSPRAVHGAGQRSLELEGQQEMVWGRQLGELTQKRNTAQSRSKKPLDVLTVPPPTKRN